MIRRLLITLLFLGISILCGSDYRKRVAATHSQPKIIYTNKRIQVRPPSTKNHPVYRTYFGIEGHYGTGVQTERTRLSKNLYREYDEPMIYNEVTFKLGYGDIGEDRLELGLAINKGYSLKDSTVESEFDTGRSIELSYFFTFESLYEPLDTTNFIPYVRFGAGIGQFDIKQAYQEYYDGTQTIIAMEYKYGAGVFSQLTRRMELTFCYLIIKREFQEIEDSGFAKEIIHDTGGLSLGLNYHF